MAVRLGGGGGSEWRVIAFPAEKLPYVGPVLLFDVRVVIFLVRTSARELDVLSLAPTLQMPVDEFRSVVGVQAQQRKGQHPRDLIQGLLHSGLPLP
jgi:hypothetical protein